MARSFDQVLPADSFLEYAFLRWVLTPAASLGLAQHVVPQREVPVGGRTYRVDYELVGCEKSFAVELDGFAFHGGRRQFSYDRMRQNDLTATGRQIVRFSYDSIRSETARCVEQLQAVMRLDPRLRTFLVAHPHIEEPEMDPDPMHALQGLPAGDPFEAGDYFGMARSKLRLSPLRTCQQGAFAALANYYRAGGQRAACVMSVGAGKTALGVAACIGFARRRALVITPGRVIRGTFSKAFDPEAVGNVVVGLPGGPMLPGVQAPSVLTLDREEGSIRAVPRARLLAADVIVTNFHSLGTGEEPGDLLSKLAPHDIDFIVVDEAHIAAAASYQRAFRYFSSARTLLMSACFQRHDGKPIDADVVFRYRLVDSIADGFAKNIRIRRFAPHQEASVYEVRWPDGSVEEVVGRDAVLEVLSDERKLARVVAKSEEPLRNLMREVRRRLDEQAVRLAPVKPRVLFAALGEEHARQVARVASEAGIPSAHLHYQQTDAQIAQVRRRFESDGGDLQGVVQIRMLGQGYDFAPISVVAPVRPYGSFGEFYQFVGRGIRVVRHPAFRAGAAPPDQILDVVYHAEFDLDGHIQALYRENDMDPTRGGEEAEEEIELPSPPDVDDIEDGSMPSGPETFVLGERGEFEQRILHDITRVEQRRAEREVSALAQRYAAYAATTDAPVTFEQYVELMRELSV